MCIVEVQSEQPFGILKVHWIDKGLAHDIAFLQISTRFIQFLFHPYFFTLVCSGTTRLLKKKQSWVSYTTWQAKEAVAAAILQALPEGCSYLLVERVKLPDGLMEEIRLTNSYGKYPMFYRVLYIPGGAGFLPSTVCWTSNSRLS